MKNFKLKGIKRWIGFSSLLKPSHVLKYVPVGLGACFLIAVFSMIQDNVDLEYKATFDYDCEKNGSVMHTSSNHFCIKGPHIFFTETSGAKVLSGRQACAIESTARKNPNMSVLVLLTSEDDADYSNKLMSSLKELKNVKIQSVNIDVLVHGTPIWYWFRAGKWKRSKWKISHLSDALRFFVIWKYGGVYLDLDIVMLRSIQHLINSVVTENWQRVASGILIFNREHELMHKTMINFVLNYNPYNFVANGPGVITKSIQNYCGISDISKISGTSCNVNIMPPEAAFPIPYDKWEKYFEVQEEVKNISSYYNFSYMLHVWNKVSALKN